MHAHIGCRHVLYIYLVTLSKGKFFFFFFFFFFFVFLFFIKESKHNTIFTGKI